jgi:hypothetical protein
MWVPALRPGSSQPSAPVADVLDERAQAGAGPSASSRG